MQYLTTYIVTLVVYVAIDGSWLSFMGARFYRPTLGDILLPGLKWPPALAFYLAYPAAALLLAILPAARQGSIAAALINGIVLGAIAYGTYDLTNFATLRNWTLQITLVDILYGAIASGIASAAGFFAAKMFSR